MIGLAIAAAVIIVILFLRFGVTVEYAEDGLFVWAHMAFIKIQIIPGKPKKLKKEKSKPRKKKEEKPVDELPAPKRPGFAFEFEKLLKEALKVLGKVRRRLLIKELTVLHIQAGGDPFKMAMYHGAELTALGLSQAALESFFRVKHYNLHTSVDFVDEKARVYVFATLTIAVWEAISIGFAALRMILRSRKTKNNPDKLEKAVGKQKN